MSALIHYINRPARDAQRRKDQLVHPQRSIVDNFDRYGMPESIYEPVKLVVRAQQGPELGFREEGIDS